MRALLTSLAFQLFIVLNHLENLGSSIGDIGKKHMKLYICVCSKPSSHSAPSTHHTGPLVLIPPPHNHLSADDLRKVNYPVGELLRFVQCALKYRAASIELRRKLAEEVCNTRVGI